jgi:hypothetical protein
VLNLFQPFQNSAEELRLRSFSSIDATPSVIYMASLNQLKRLVYAHHIRNPPLPTKCWFNTAVLRVSTEVLKNATYDSDWYFYFRLCLAFWKNAYVGHRSFLLIARANLAAALQFGALRGSVASEMEEEVNAAGKHHEASDEAVISGLLDPGLAIDDLQGAQMVAFARRLDELILFDELTTGNESAAGPSS